MTCWRIQGGSAPAMITMIQIIIISPFLMDWAKKKPRLDVKGLVRAFTGYKKTGAFVGADNVFQWRGAEPFSVYK